jgi:hypothetical protein
MFNFLFGKPKAQSVDQNSNSLSQVKEIAKRVIFPQSSKEEEEEICNDCEKYVNFKLDTIFQQCTFLPKTENRSHPKDQMNA